MVFNKGDTCVKKIKDIKLKYTGLPDYDVNSFNGQMFKTKDSITSSYMLSYVIC